MFFCNISQTTVCLKHVLKDQVTLHFKARSLRYKFPQYGLSVDLTW